MSGAEEILTVNCTQVEGIQLTEPLINWDSF